MKYIPMILTFICFGLMITLSSTTSAKKPIYYLVQVTEDAPEISIDWARVILAHDSIEAKINMFQFIQRIAPRDDSQFRKWLMRKLDFDNLEYNVVHVRYIK